MSTTRPGETRRDPGGSRPAPRSSRRKKESRIKSALAVLISLGMLAGLAGGAWWGVQKVAGVVDTGGDDFAGEGTTPIMVTVNNGDSAAQIGRMLKSKGVVKTVTAFVEAARADEESTKIQPGAYNLKLEMSGAAAVAALLDSSARAELKVTVPEGFRVSQVVARLAKNTKLPAAQFNKALENPKLGLPEWAEGNPEGFLFPATYEIPPGENALQILQRMVRRSKQEFARLGIEEQDGQDPYDLLIIASLAEKEANTNADFGKVARVVYNRLDIGEALYFDSTTVYAHGDEPGFDDARLAELLDEDDDYNTRLRAGLPPTPISNPGSAALKAAISPPEGDWRWFLTNTEGETFFFEDFDEFNAAKDQGVSSVGGG